MFPMSSFNFMVTPHIFIQLPTCVPSSAPKKGRSGGPALRKKTEGNLQHPAASDDAMEDHHV